MKKLVICFLLLGITPAYAQPERVNFTTEADAVTVATNTIKMKGLIPSVGYSVYTVPCGSHVAMYEVVFESGQSVIVSGHKSELPVISIREQSNGISCFLHPEEYPTGYLKMLDRIHSVQVSCHEKCVSDSVRNIWNRFFSYSDNDNENQMRAPVIGPFLKTKWAQRHGNGCSDCCSDYNRYMPLTNDTCNEDTLYRYPTGCTVTAFGQVMNYWKYPVLRRSKPRQIDWCNMPDSIFCSLHGETSQKEREAVAHLMKILGDELGVIYGPPRCEGRIDWLNYQSRLSNFGFLDPAVALILLKLNFGYSYSADCLCRALHEEEWHDLIKDELEAGRPVVYWAFEDDELLSGHTFVCDGYDPNTDNFHFNWGHGREGDWVSLSDIRESSETHWNFYQWAIVKFEPEIMEDFCNGSVWLTAFYERFYQTHHTDEYRPYNVVPTTMAYLYSADATDRYIYRTIPAGATATYQAHKEIVLRDGFTVEAGADFTAQIVPCPNCENRGEGVVEEGPGDSNANPQGADTEEALNARPSSPVSLTDLHPNPTSGEVIVTMEDEVQGIILYNTQGQPVGGWKILSLAGNRATLDVSALSAGPYLVRIATPSGTVTKKLVVQRR